MKKQISYVIPFYNDSGNVYKLHDTITSVLKRSKYFKKYDFEFIFINDGSSDGTLTELATVEEKDIRVKVLDLSRNYGHQIAVTAGIDCAGDDAVIIMDSDLQDPPLVSLELIDKWEQGYNVVYAVRKSRKDTFFKRATASLFYRILESLSEVKIPRNKGDFRLIDRKVVTELKKYNEHNRFLRGMISYIGFKQAPIYFDRDERYSGTTGYSLKKLMKFAKDGILGFSSAPLKFISRMGYFIASLSVIGIIYAICYKLFYPGAIVEGWAFIVISFFFIGGIQLVMLGVLGSYIGRIYTEVRNRPLYSLNSKDDEAHDAPV